MNRTTTLRTLAARSRFAGAAVLSCLAITAAIASCDAGETIVAPIPDAGAPKRDPAAPKSDAGADSGDASSDAGTDVTVVTSGGPVVGTESGGVRAFLGVPYAAAPVGALRWKAPKEARWSEPRAVKAFGPRCFGVSFLDPSKVRAGASEDCLSLNVWSPAGASKKPVLVWIHGGGFIDGTSADYPGAELAAAGDVVVVTLNYRLGALGTLAIPSADGGGNLGLLDQRLALQWVRDNVAAFGGDPAKVTLAGHSAGAQSALTHASIPGSQGLFGALLLESAGFLPQTPAQAAGAATSLAKAWGCSTSADAGAAATIDEACLRALPAETVVRGNLSGQFLPIVDGTVVPTTPLAALAAGTFAKVPVLAGFNANEGYFFTDGQYAGLPLASASDYTNALGATFGPLAPTLQSQYPLSQYADDPRAAFAALLRDGFIECPTRKLVASSASPAFGYVFDHAPALKSPKPVLAMHTVELPFVWGTPLPWTWWSEAGAGLPSTPKELDLARQMKRYWASFIATHAPSAGEGAPAWPAFSTASQSAMTFADTPAVAPLAANAHCGFWDHVFGG